MLWVYDHYQYFTLSVRGPTLDIRIRCLWSQILTSIIGPRAVRAYMRIRHIQDIIAFMLLSIFYE